MWPQLIITCITILGTGFTASLSYWLAKRREQFSAEHQRKVGQYTDLFDAISALANKEEGAIQKYTRAFNKMLLVAPQHVLSSLHEFQTKMNEDGPLPLNSPVLRALILAVRNDLRIQPPDSFETFRATIMIPSEERRQPLSADNG